MEKTTNFTYSLLLIASLAVIFAPQNLILSTIFFGGFALFIIPLPVFLKIKLMVDPLNITLHLYEIIKLPIKLKAARRRERFTMWLIKAVVNGVKLMDIKVIRTQNIMDNPNILTIKALSLITSNFLKPLAFKNNINLTFHQEFNETTNTPLHAEVRFRISIFSILTILISNIAHTIMEKVKGATKKWKKTKTKLKQL